MKITVFGGTGKTGQLLVKRALSEGHSVVAYVRNPAKLTLADPRLTVVAGSLSDASAVSEAVRGADAVLSVLGPSGTGAAGTPLTEGIRVITAAMKAQGVRRFVASATFSVTDPSDHPPLTVRLLVAVIRRIASGAYRDILGIGAAVRASGLDWTLVRVGLLNDRPSPGPATAGYLGHGVKLALSRASFAEFMLRQADSSSCPARLPRSAAEQIFEKPDATCLKPVACLGFRHQARRPGLLACLRHEGFQIVGGFEVLIGVQLRKHINLSDGGEVGGGRRSDDHSD